MVEERLAARLEKLSVRWAFGGHAAGYRLHPYYRSAATALVVEGASEAMASALRLVPKHGGEVWLMQPPGPLAFAEHGQIVRPLLAYIEMLCHHDDRTRDAAERVRSEHLEALA